MRYKIYNEDGEFMRVTHRKEEALATCALRSGWTFKAERAAKQPQYTFEEALF